jgi:hypothetical protein
MSSKDTSPPSEGMQPADVNAQVKKQHQRHHGNETPATHQRQLHDVPTRNHPPAEADEAE